MPETLIKVDLTKSAYENDMIHNRWHPDVPIVAWVNPGDDFIIETYDWTGGFIKNNNSADDVRDIDLSIVHFLSGPIGVKGAEPGDLLVVDLLDIGPKKEIWGFNGFFSKKMVAVSSPNISRWRRSRSGTSRASIPPRAMCPVLTSRVSCIPVWIGCLPASEDAGDWNRAKTR